MKTLGIIGGLGPMATAYFMELVTGMTDVDCDQKHIPIVLRSIPQTPDRTSYILDHIQKIHFRNGRSRKTVEGGGGSVSCNPVCYSTLFLQGALPANRSANYFSVGKTADYFRTEGVDEVAILATSGTVMSKIIQQELGKNISRRCCLMKDSNRKSWRLYISRLRPDAR